MHYTTLASLLALTPLTTAIPSLQTRQTPTTGCASDAGGVHIIAAPGEGSASPPYGLIGSLVSSIQAQIPGSDAVPVPYDHEQTNGQLQTTDGANTLESYISQYQAACPSTQMVLLGYSAGAVITMNVLCGYSGAGPLSNPNVIAAVVYGDETRTAGASYDLGSCTGEGEHPRVNPAGCEAWAGKLQSYANAEDPLSCATTGTDMEAHYEYPQEYDAQAAAFVVSQFSGGA